MRQQITRFHRLGLRAKGGGSAACGHPMFLQVLCVLCPPQTTVGPRTHSVATVQGAEPVQCGGWGSRGSLMRAEQGTEIKREGGRGLRAHPREAAPGPAALGSRARGPGLGPGQPGTERKPRSRSRRHIEKCRVHQSHLCFRGRLPEGACMIVTGRASRKSWRGGWEPDPPSTGMVAGAPSHPAAPKGHAVREH